MSKILIDSDLLKDLLEGDFLPVKVWHERRKEGRKLLEESKGKHFSVVEWHPISEKPINNINVLVKDINGLVYEDAVYYDDVGNWLTEKSYKFNLVEWAYLPE